jgi:hypothetical protein
MPVRTGIQKGRMPCALLKFVDSGSAQAFGGVVGLRFEKAEHWTKVQYQSSAFFASFHWG